MRKIAIVLFSAAFMLSFGFAAVAAGPAAVAVSNGKTVTLNYTLTVNGKVVDSSKGRRPLVVRIGAHQVIPGFEKGVMGMKIGQKKSFMVSPREGYGEVNPKAIVKVAKNKLPQNIKPVAGMVLYATGPGGQVLPVKVVNVGKNNVLMDFNNPLAGKTLKFDVEIVDVK
ncbi:MAG: peptidylprolyl isomerase [Nitrospiraceae bacterium]|nr:peptidylprolyl isomerase [Nitrospiraceae bacterium]